MKERHCKETLAEVEEYLETVATDVVEERPCTIGVLIRYCSNDDENDNDDDV